MDSKLNLVIGRGQQSRFEESAKLAFPKEKFAFLLGRRRKGGVLQILGFYTPKNADKFCSQTGVRVQRHWLPEAEKAAEGEGMVVLGDIHSHTYSHEEIQTSFIVPDCAPSEFDLIGNQHWGDIFGICSVIQQKNGSKKTRVKYWGPSSIVKIGWVP